MLRIKADRNNKDSPSVIYVPKTPSGPYKYLSNDSIYPMKIEEKIYPSVTHYVQSKKFQGTLYEEEIRECKCVAQIRLKSLSRLSVTTSGNGEGEKYSVIHGKKIKGANSVSSYKLKENLCVGIRAKFDQYPALRKKLVNTYPIDIMAFDPMAQKNRDVMAFDSSSVTDRLTAKILRDVRNELSNPYFKELKDVNFVKSNKVNFICTIIIDISMCIASLEKWDRVFPEMVKDAITCVCSKNVSDEYFKDPMNINKKSIPKNVAMLKNIIREQFIELDPSQEGMDGPTNEISNFIVWLYLNDGINEVWRRCNSYYQVYKDDISKLKSITNIKDTLSNNPLDRWYRKKHS